MTEAVLPFSKMHGGGNDFVIVNAVHRLLPALDFRHLAARRDGVGCDQILILQAPKTPAADFEYRIINADGGEVGQCGNGARCAHVFAQRQGLTDKKCLRLQTSHTVITTTGVGDGIVRAELAVPQFAPANIPLLCDKQNDTYTADNVIDAGRFAALSLGNPHAVFFVSDETAAAVREIGFAFNRAHELFPVGVNVGFCRVIDACTLALRVYERGVGETPSCGSGAVAAAVAAMQAGFVHTPVQVCMRGVELRCGWEGASSPAWLEGPITHVFDGVIPLSNVQVEA
ncbi:diaminopimelate epimerase [Candidatus Persebacteraceae bacterium Df01]|jgi:diaminopimelate epimerase|uniref:Diaminopimelate epimerase n=1 Tax=Candidatus Doriopsillibacter californiensis TaxID=2970740 RepID=A0ABT7QK11_9GAMM|nr:diaminopimelate epimerase [Candidatus Persebacteraceae bacterium Df01]